MNLSMQHRSWAWYFAVVFIANFPTSSIADTLFTADDPRINYYGRFDFTNPLSPRWNWSGSIIEARFSGPSIGIGLIDGMADYEVEIDGAVDTVLRTKNTIERYDAGGFSDARHTIRIIQRSENHTSAATFKGFYLANGKTLDNAVVKPSRKIEFIGNSDLVGYGVESPGRSCNNNQIRLYTNTNLSYGPLITKAFNAQSTILGWSGKGIVRNYDSPTKRSSTNFTAYYDNTLGSLDTKWDFAKWIPDLVIIVLGWNDFYSSSGDSTKLPDDTMFIGDYHKFISRIYSHYPDAAVLCVATHIGHLVDYIKQVVTEETSSLQHPKVYFAEYPPEDSFTTTGCNTHPSIIDHHLIAKALIDTVRKRLGWDTGMVDVRPLPNSISQTGYRQSFHVSMTGQQICISGVGSLESGTAISIRLFNGRTVWREKIDGKNSMIFSTATLPAGVYLIGSKALGWKRFTVTR
jgi:hypothetical protein